MLATRLHPGSRYRPCPFREVDLVPSGADDLAGARRCKDRKLERAAGNPVLFPQLRYKGTDLGVGQRGMMLDAANFRFSGQEVFEMPAPPRRVLARPIAARRCPVEHRLDATAHPTGS